MAEPAAGCCCGLRHEFEPQSDLDAETFMGASGLLVALTSDRTWAAALVTAAAAVPAFATGSIRSGCCWPGILGFRWRYLTKIGRQDRRTGINAIQKQNGRQACAGERDR